MKEDPKKEDNNGSPFEQNEPDVQKKKDEIDSQLTSGKSSFELPEPPEWNFNRKRDGLQPESSKQDFSDGRGLGLGLIAGYALVGPILAGWFIGYMIDRSQGGQNAQTLGVLIGMPLGLLGIIYILSKYKDKQ